MTHIAMLLKKCAYCRKDIPSSIVVCPYCHRDEKGQDVTLVEESSTPSLDAQAKADLNSLASDDVFERRNAADRLSQRGSAIVPMLINRLNEQNHKGLSEAARLLGRLRDRRAISALAQALKIGDEELRASAAWALGQLTDPQVLEEFLQESQRPNPVIQGYVAYRLAEYQDARVLPTLMKLARLPNREVSFQAVWAMGEAGNSAAVSFLLRMLRQKDPLLRAVTETALRRLGGPVRRTTPVLGFAIGGMVVAGLVLAAILWHFYR